MYTLAITAQKGGPGKTTTALALGALMHKAGHRILFIDADPQGNLSSSLLQEEATNTLYDVLNGSIPITSATYAGLYGPVIAPGDRLKEKDPIQGSQPEYALKRALEAIKRGAYDVCIIDSGPQLGLLVANMTAADGLIIPTRPDRYGLDMLPEIYRTYSTVKAATNKRLQMLGILITQYNGRVNLCRDILAALEAQARILHTKVYQPPVRFTMGVTAWQYGEFTERSTAGQDYAELATRIMEDMKLK